MPTLPKILGKNIAINIDFIICAPMKIGNNNFFSPKAKKPNPNPVKNEFFPKLSRAVTKRKLIYNFTKIMSVYAKTIIFE